MCLDRSKKLTFEKSFSLGKDQIVKEIRELESCT